MDPRPMYSNEVDRLCLLFPDLKPTNAELLEAICWSYKDITCQKLTLRASEPPTDRIWTFSSAGKHGSPRVDTRPATTTEIEKFISVLRDFTCGDDLQEPVAENCL